MPVFLGQLKDTHAYYFKSNLDENIRWVLKPTNNDVHILVLEKQDHGEEEVIYHLSMNKTLEFYSKLVEGRLIGTIGSWIAAVVGSNIERTYMWATQNLTSVERYGQKIMEDVNSGGDGETVLMNDLACHLHLRSSEFFIYVNKVN